MKDNINQISRRQFIQRGLTGMGGLALLPHMSRHVRAIDDWPQDAWLGRNNVYLPSALSIRTKPFVDAPVVRQLQEDECVMWLREVVGGNPIGRTGKKWVETPEGFVYAPSLQKVKNSPNQPISDLPLYGANPGMWVEVTVPYVNLELINPLPNSPWLKEVNPNRWRLYYSQVIWVDQIKTGDDGQIKYRVNELHGSYGDVFWADASAFRIIPPDELAPIHPDVADKRIIINNNLQTLTCYEGNNEVYFCQVSTGKKLDPLTGLIVDTWATPVGEHWIWRKLISIHMAGGGGQGTDGWDTMAVPWTSLFVGEGVAIHATFWHNDFGTPRSHGCVNTLPEDAKWIYLWSSPQVPYDPGDVTLTNYSGTRIQVVEPQY